MPKKVRTQKPNLGRLPTPHGSTPWHFRHEAISGNGFNGVIRHMWREPVTHLAIPGLGVVQHHGN